MHTTEHTNVYARLAFFNAWLLAKRGMVARWLSFDSEADARAACGRLTFPN